MTRLPWINYHEGGATVNRLAWLYYHDGSARVTRILWPVTVPGRVGHRPAEAGHVLQDGVCRPGHWLHHTGSCLLLSGGEGWLCPGYNVVCGKRCGRIWYSLESWLMLGSVELLAIAYKTVSAITGSLVSTLNCKKLYSTVDKGCRPKLQKSSSARSAENDFFQIFCNICPVFHHFFLNLWTSKIEIPQKYHLRSLQMMQIM